MKMFLIFVCFSYIGGICKNVFKGVEKLLYIKNDCVFEFCFINE